MLWKSGVREFQSCRAAEGSTPLGAEMSRRNTEVDGGGGSEGPGDVKEI